MVDNQLVLSNVQCFTTAKFGKVASKLLKTLLLDFYDVQDLVDAKKQLLSDIKGTSTTFRLFQNDATVSVVWFVVNDIFTLLTFLDENLQLNQFPNYVADGPDSLPSTRLYKRDLGVLMKLLEKMDGRIMDLRSWVPFSVS